MKMKTKRCEVCGICIDSSENITAKCSDSYYCSVECLIKPKWGYL